MSPPSVSLSFPQDAQYIAGRCWVALLPQSYFPTALLSDNNRVCGEAGSWGEEGKKRRRGEGSLGFSRRLAALCAAAFHDGILWRAEDGERHPPQHTHSLTLTLPTSSAPLPAGIHPNLDILRMKTTVPHPRLAC